MLKYSSELEGGGPCLEELAVCFPLPHCHHFLGML